MTIPPATQGDDKLRRKIQDLLFHEPYPLEAILSLLQAARLEAEKLDFTIDTDVDGNDYIQFFDRESARIYGDKKIIRYMYDRLRTAAGDKL